MNKLNSNEEENIKTEEKDKFEIITSTGEKLNLTKTMVQKYLSPNASITDEEFMYFFQLCKVQRLNPFLKEAYIIKYGNAPATIVTDYKVLQQIADRSGQFAGIEQGIVVLDKENNIVERNGQVKAPSDKLIGGWAKVYRRDRDRPFYVSVNYDEFVQKKNGSPISNWASKPAFMIEKVAKAHAFRVAFPQEMQGVYIEDEMSNNGNHSLRNNQEEIIKQEEPEIFEQEVIKENTEESIIPKAEDKDSIFDFDAI